MKRLLSVIIAVIMVFTASLTIFAGYDMIGDVDGNGKITAADARSTLRVAARIEVFSDEQIAVADVDNSGDITASDARAILRVAAGLEAFEEKDEEEQLPDFVQALYDGTFKFASVYAAENFRYVDYFAMKDGITYYVAEASYDDYEEHSYITGYILYEDGTCIEFDADENIACLVDDDYVANWNDVDYLRVVGAINDESTMVSVSEEYINDIKYDVYTFSNAYGTVKFLAENGEVKRYICYDKAYYEMINIDIHEFTDDFDMDHIDADSFTVYSYNDYMDYWYGDETYYDYLEDAYWADAVDWDSVEGTVVTDENALPEEYSLIASDKYYISCFSRAVAGEDDLFAEGDYSYFENSQYYNNGVLKVCDDYGVGISFLYVPEKNLLGKEEVACYLIYEEGGIYTKFDQVIAAMFGDDYSEITDIQTSELKLLEDRAHTVTVKETEIDGDKYVKLSCAYDDGSYTTDFVFVNGELYRFDEYDSEGEYVGTMLVYEYTTDIDDSVTSVDGYERVSAVSFFASMFDF